jgi:ATP/ADP translocase
VDTNPGQGVAETVTNLTPMREWLNIRPRELRPLLLAMAAAFFLLSFMVLSRSLRESLFLAHFTIEKLPLMMGAVVLVNLPMVSQFSRFLVEYKPKKILTGLTLTLVVGLVFFWAMLPVTAWAISGLYVWTTIGGLLMASGFWIIVAEIFPLRGAKRLFSLIGAGGTLGAMLTGFSISAITKRVDLPWLVLLSTVLPLVFLFLVRMLPDTKGEIRPASPAKGGIPLIEASRKTWSNRHLRLMASIIFLATLAMTLVDFQFKDLAQQHFDNGQELAGFLGIFYGGAGLVSLLLQIFLSGRLVENRGVAFSLSLPALLLVAGGAGLLFFPFLAIATVVRGTDYSLRKSLFRPTMEVLFVSVPTKLRRLTKTFIDTIVDSAAEGFGALIILFWLSVLGWPVPWLSGVIIIVALAYFALSRLISHSYFQTITGRLQEEASRAQQPDDEGLQLTGHLLRATFTNLDFSELHNLAPEPEKAPSDAVAEDQIIAGLSSSDDRVVMATLAGINALDPDHLVLLTRLMARDQLFKKVATLLQRFPQYTARPLIDLLLGEETDFVIKRRIPEILAGMGGQDADDALLDVLTDNRFEVRYRAALALLARRKNGLPVSGRKWHLMVWHAISLEVRKDRPLWELQKLLDTVDAQDDDLISLKVGVRGELSLEHTFRMLSLVLDPEQVRAAYHGVLFDDPQLKSFALEYLEMVLPRNVRQRLWLFIGDVSEKRKEQQTRSFDHVVADLMDMSQTLFHGEVSRLALERMVVEREAKNLPKDKES